MTKYTIKPIRTTLIRAWEYARGKREDYLEKLTRFSKYVALSIRRRLGANFFTIERIRENGYSEIAAILEKKGIKSIKFDVSCYNKPLPLKKTDRIVAASVRAIIRHLATYGIQKETQKGYIDYHLGDDNWLKGDFTIEASEESSVTVSLEVRKLNPLRN